MDFSFDSWFHDLGISENGLKCVVRAELTDLKALVLVDISDLDDLKLSLGDRGKLKYGVEVLKAENAELFKRRHSSGVKQEDGNGVPLKTEPKVNEQSQDQKYSVEEVTALLEN